ncbi:MAG TPA: sigma-70 family RNA polymerase sigma factor [Polyangiaceae bacterium]|nr:sigma-70 family RNA polymerase sigma factor [Polyangiaceae bacterium]
MVPSRAAPKAEGVVLPLGFAGDAAALVEALRANHPGAKAAFFQRHVGWVERIITHVIGFDAELSDILQEVFTRALASIHSLKDPSALEPWLGRVATHTARKVLRSRSRRNWLRRFVDSAEEERYEPSAVAFAPEARQALRAVYRVLDVLPADERIAFALRFVDGMELTEVAAACDVSLATIKRRLVRSERRFVAVATRYPELKPWLEGGARWRDR